MATAIKKTISLLPELATQAEEITRPEGKTLSAVIQDAPSQEGIPRDPGLLEPQGQGKRDPIRTGPRSISQGVRVVFDTNIFVSAFVFPGSRAEAALLRVVEGKDGLNVSKAIARRPAETRDPKRSRFFHKL